MMTEQSSPYVNHCDVMDVCPCTRSKRFTMSIQLQSDNTHSSHTVHASEWTDLATLPSKSKIKPQAGTKLPICHCNQSKTLIHGKYTKHMTAMFMRTVFYRLPVVYLYPKAFIWCLKKYHKKLVIKDTNESSFCFQN